MKRRKRRHLRLRTTIDKHELKTMLRTIARLELNDREQKRALRDAVSYMDRFRRGDSAWTAADVKRLEEIRALALF